MGVDTHVFIKDGTFDEFRKKTRSKLIKFKFIKDYKDYYMQQYEVNLFTNKSLISVFKLEIDSSYDYENDTYIPTKSDSETYINWGFPDQTKGILIILRYNIFNQFIATFLGAIFGLNRTYVLWKDVENEKAVRLSNHDLESGILTLFDILTR